MSAHTNHSTAAYDAAQPDPRRPKRKNKPGAGRPDEGRERLSSLWVLPATARAIRRAVKGDTNTLGKVLDATFADK